MQITRAAVTDAVELERAVDAFAQQLNAALIVLPNIVTVLHRDLIIALAARHRLPGSLPVPRLGAPPRRQAGIFVAPAHVRSWHECDFGNVRRHFRFSG